MRARTVVLPAVAVLVLAAPAGALGATVAVVNGVPTFTAGKGETNLVTVSPYNGNLEFEDSGGVTVKAGAGCYPHRANSAKCPLAPSVTIRLFDGDDSADVNKVACQCFGDAGNDILRTRQGADTLYGGDGDDTLDGGGQPDELIGGAGMDTVLYDSPVPVQTRSYGVTVTLDGAANDGSVQDGVAGSSTRDNVHSDIETIYGSHLDDTITGDGGDSWLDGGDGNDVLDGGLGADDVHGGAGFDEATFATRTDAVTVQLDDGFNDGNAGRDACSSHCVTPGVTNYDNVHSDVEKITGGSDNDDLAGTSNGEVIDGGSGDDYIKGRYDLSAPPATRNPDDHLIGGPGNDLLWADSYGNHTLEGGSDNDSLAAANGSDVLQGGPGDDDLTGWGGNDVIDGGPGLDGPNGDTVDYGFSSSVTVTLDGQANDGSPALGEQDDVRNTIENVIGSTYSDTITGNDGPNVLTGDWGFAAGGGDDQLRGLGGEDVLHGRDGNDTLDGGSEDDRLDGGPGADVLQGSSGYDELEARDGLADVLIDCGADGGIPYYDFGIDPSPSSCGNP